MWAIVIMGFVLVVMLLAYSFSFEEDKTRRIVKMTKRKSGESMMKKLIAASILLALLLCALYRVDQVAGRVVYSFAYGVAVGIFFQLVFNHSKVFGGLKRPSLMLFSSVIFVAIFGTTVSMLAWRWLLSGKQPSHSYGWLALGTLCSAVAVPAFGAVIRAVLRRRLMKEEIELSKKLSELANKFSYRSVPPDFADLENRLVTVRARLAELDKTNI